jgi:hypothetical protein
MNLFHNRLYLFLPVFAASTSFGQVKTFTAREAVQYALQNSPTIKNAMIDTDIAKSKVMETTAAGLPQISGSATLLHYPEVQRFVLENTPGTAFYTNQLASGAPIAFGLQLANSVSGTVNATQLIFNGSYLVGLQASKTEASKNHIGRTGDESILHGRCKPGKKPAARPQPKSARQYLPRNTSFV